MLAKTASLGRAAQKQRDDVSPASRLQRVVASHRITLPLHATAAAAAAPATAPAAAPLPLPLPLPRRRRRRRRLLLLLLQPTTTLLPAAAAAATSTTTADHYHHNHSDDYYYDECNMSAHTDVDDNNVYLKMPLRIKTATASAEMAQVLHRHSMMATLVTKTRMTTTRSMSHESCRLSFKP